MFASEDGAWTVETVRLSLVAAPSRITDPADGAGGYYLVRYHGSTMGTVRTPAEVAALGCDLAALAEV